jgi:phospholipid/cholesterol/gamma-HCH transport system ATP-binding protein
VIFIYNGAKWWDGTKDDVMKSDNPELQKFLASSYFGF